MTTSDWYRDDTNHGELRSLLIKGALKSAVDVLQYNARASGPTSNDPVAIALHHRLLVGYQKAIDDLKALSQPKPAKPKTPSDNWSHAAKSE